MNGALNEVAVCTVVAKNFMAHARALSDSLRRFQPDIALFAVLSDEVDGYFSPADEPFQILRLDDMAIPQLKRLRLQYSRKELAIVAKSFLINHMLDRGFGSVLFLDPDMLILNDIGSLIADVRRHSVTLTPHLITPSGDGDRAARELRIIQSGSYNAGVIGVSDTLATRRFLSWWQDRVLDNCRDGVAEGLYYDQRWLDLVPIFFEDVRIVRDPGVNIGHWNLGERNVRFDGDVAMSGDQPVRIFHFSGFDPDRQPAVTRYTDTLTLDTIGPAAALYRHYASLLNAAGYQDCKSWPYAYGQPSDPDATPNSPRE